MQVTETLSEGLRRGFTVVVPAADIEGKRSAKLSEIGRGLKLPGFRPGKIPASLVRQRYGTAVMAEVLQESVDDATTTLLADRGLRASGQPKVDLVSGLSGDAPFDLEFKVEVELLPQITPPDFAAITLTRLRAEPSVETIDKALASVAERQRTLEPVSEDRGAESGEFVTVDFIGRVDGVPFEGGSGTDMDVEVGGGGFIPGFSEQFAGLKAGESRTIEVQFPADYQAAELAGKAATFDLTAKALQRRLPTALDDALAGMVGFESLDKMRAVISQQIQGEYDQLSRLRIKRELLDALAERADFPAPDGLVKQEFDAIWARVEQDAKEGRADAEDKDKDPATLRAEYHAIAERRVRLGLLLAEIGRLNTIAVTPDELTRAMRIEAQRYPGQEAQVVEFFRKNPQAVETLRGPIFEDKVVDYILELAQVTDKTVPPEELTPPAEEQAKPLQDEAAQERAADEAAAEPSLPA